MNDFGRPDMVLFSEKLEVVDILLIQTADRGTEWMCEEAVAEADVEVFLQKERDDGKQ